MIVLKRIDGEPGHQIVEALDGVDLDVWETTALPVPADLEAKACTFDASGAVPVPRTLSPRDVLNLYTGAERRRILTSSVPEVQELVAYLLTETSGLVCGSVAHVQGTALIAGLGLLDAPEREALILAGDLP